jgi:hypothetical protein
MAELKWIEYRRKRLVLQSQYARSPFRTPGRTPCYRVAQMRGNY